MKKFKTAYIIAGFSLSWLLIWAGLLSPNQSEAGAIYGPMIFFGDVTSSNYTALAGVNFTFTNSTNGTFTNGVPVTNYYRLCATNTRGRIPLTGIYTQEWTGTTNLSNEITMTWFRKGGMSGHVVEFSTNNTIWTNWTKLSASTTSFTDYGTTAWSNTVFTSVYSVIPAPFFQGGVETQGLHDVLVVSADALGLDMTNTGDIQMKSAKKLYFGAPGNGNYMDSTRIWTAGGTSINYQAGYLMGDHGWIYDWYTTQSVRDNGAALNTSIDFNDRGLHNDASTLVLDWQDDIEIPTNLHVEGYVSNDTALIYKHAYQWSQPVISYTSSNMVFNCTNGNIQTVTSTGNFYITHFPNAQPLASYSMIIIAGGDFHTGTFQTGFVWDETAGPPTFSTNAGATDFVSFVAIATNRFIGGIGPQNVQ